MFFDPSTFTLTLDRKDCQTCRYNTPGTVATKIDCPTCKGTGKGARGGARGCKQCHGSGNAYDQENRSTCPTCKGSPQRSQLESWCDNAPIEAVSALQLRIVRQDRAASWNEQFLGLNTLWSTTDYGKAWEMDDIGVLSKVREHLLNDRTQAIKLLAGEYDRDATTAQIVRGLAVVVTNGGYSVRADTSMAESIAEREPDYAQAHRIGMAVYNAGGNGTMAAASPVPQRAEAPAVVHLSRVNDSECIHCHTRIGRSHHAGAWFHWASGSMYCPTSPAPEPPEEAKASASTDAA